MKRFLSLLLVVVMLFSFAAPMSVSAATSLPNSIYLYPTMGGETCTLVSAAMMHRARMYLSGDSNWSSVTEYSIYNVAWTNGIGLNGRWTFNINGNSMSVSRAGVSGISIASLKSILNAHPEGIVLYSGTLYHAVFLTDYEGDTFYCADPYGGSYSGRRMKLAESYLGRLAGGSQANVLSHVTAYWYISSSSFPNVYGTLTNLGDSFYASIGRADAAGELLSVADADDGTLTFAKNADQSAQQRWKFTRQSDGSYIIRSMRSDYVLNVDNGSSADGTLATVWKDIGNEHQRWYVYSSNGSYSLVSKSTGKLLTIYRASTGQNSKLYSYSKSAEQMLDIHIHNYRSETVAASCLSGGYTHYRCTGCSDNYTVSDGTPVTGHTWTAAGYTQATCQQLGSVTYTCTACGESYTEPTEIVWSDWSETKPAAAKVETKTQYRYRDREHNWAQSEQGTIRYVSSWPAGFRTSSSLYSQYNKTPKTASETDSRKVTITSDQTVGYLYFHWCRGTYTDGPINRLISDIAEGDMTAFHAFYSATAAGHTDANGVYVADACYFYNADCCRDTYWYFQIPVKQQTYTVEEKRFDGERWTQWSDWSDTETAETDNRQVETRTLYRYAEEGYADHSWDSGKVTLAPTATSDGQKTYTCTVCKEKKTEVIPADGGSVTPPVENSFKDIKPKDFFYDAVLWAVEQKITTGTSATTFAPNNACTRAQVVTFLYRAAGEPKVSKSENPFTDIVPGSYYYNAVLWAVNEGITKGTSDTTFSPDMPCSRSQVVTFLWRFKDQPIANTRTDFSDIETKAYYYNAVCWAVENGITQGVGNNLFAPDVTCTRSQIVTLLYRAIA